MSYEAGKGQKYPPAGDIDGWKNIEKDEDALQDLEQDSLKERGDICGTVGGENDYPEPESNSSHPTSTKERTGVSHLVHSWYPQGHNVSQLDIYSLTH